MLNNKTRLYYKEFQLSETRGVFAAIAARHRQLRKVVKMDVST